ncbi:hypothetical protein HYS92_00220 [Candidatus Daviesbacteria bacterium]|nr:hypothetical protein [Candidatus Daviesbacteria bacterium]
MDDLPEEKRNHEGSIFGVIVIIGLIWWFFFRQADTWQGFYYPNAGDLTRDIKSPIYKSIDECRDWVDSMVDRYNPSGEGYDYECGKNCKIKDGMTILVCETTER